MGFLAGEATQGELQGELALITGISLCDRAEAVIQSITLFLIWRIVLKITAISKQV